MTKPYYKPPTPIDQAEIIPLSERTELYQEIHESLIKLERLDPRGLTSIKRYIDLCIEYDWKEQENKGAEIIQFEGGK